MSPARAATWSVCLLLLASGTHAAEDGATPEQLRALYVGQWKLTSHWTNDVKQLGTRPGESMGSYTGTATISDRDGLLILEIVGDAPIGQWEKELAIVPTPYRLALDVRKMRRRAGVTEYTKLDLVLSPDLTTLRGVASWSNGLNANRSNEGQLVQAQTPSVSYPWGVGGSSLCLKRVDPPPVTPIARPTPQKGPTLLLEAADPDKLADEKDLAATLDELAEWLTLIGYDVRREESGTPPDLRGVLEVARFQANITGQEFYLDTLNNQPVKFLKGTIHLSAGFSIKDAKGKRALLNVSLARGRDSSTPNDNPKTRSVQGGTIMLPPNMSLDLERILNLLPGQAAALPPKQKRAEYFSRLDELLSKGE